MSDTPRDRQLTVAALLARCSIGPDDNGPHCLELRALFERKLAEGMRSAQWSWGPDAFKLSAEERARCLLEIEWELERGHSHGVTQMDGLKFTRYDFKKKRRVFSLRPAAEWLGDRRRSAVARLRVWRDRMLGVSNPYRRKA